MTPILFKGYSVLRPALLWSLHPQQYCAFVTGPLFWQLQRFGCPFKAAKKEGTNSKKEKQTRATTKELATSILIWGVASNCRCFWPGWVLSRSLERQVEHFNTRCLGEYLGLHVKGGGPHDWGPGVNQFNSGAPVSMRMF